MVRSLQRTHLIGALIVSGIVVATLSALESHVAWISAFCGMLGDGCRDTALYRLLGLPIAPWGVAFYAVLGLLFLRRRSWLFPAVMAGVGFEMVFVRIMVEEQFLCVFCAANFLLLAALFLCLFDRKRAWEKTAIVFLSFAVAGFLVSDGRKSPHFGDSVLAEVGEREITTADVERPLTSKLHKLQQEIHAMKSDVLDARVENLLLELAAEEQGLTVDELVAKVRGRVPLPGEHVVKHYYDSKLYQQWGTATGSEQEIKQQIREYLHHRDSTPLMEEYTQKLRTRYPVEIYLKAPPLPSTRVRVDGAPTLGPADALVTVVELSDFHCPSCRKGHGVVEQIKKKYEGKVRWVFKDRPLDSHPGARELALAARCVHAEGKFWAYQDLLFSSKKKPGVEEAMAYAEELGFDPVCLKERMADPELAAALEQDVADLREAGINTTPSFIINGKLRPGMPSMEEFIALIDEALGAAEDSRGER